jgi:guanosine-diphosphatase
MRRTSVSLPTKQAARDPHEKPARYDAHHRDPGFLNSLRAAWMSQAQKARWLKTAAIVFAVVFLFYWLSPTGVDVYNGGRATREADHL